MQLAAGAVTNLGAHRDERGRRIVEERGGCFARGRVSLVLSLSKDERLAPRPPTRIAARAGDAEVSREPEMSFELIAIH